MDICGAVSDAEALDSPQRHYDLRAVFNAMRWLVRTGASWRTMPNDLPPWPAVCQQMQRWLRAGCFEALVHDLRVLLRERVRRHAQPTAMILGSRTVQSTPESGGRAPRLRRGRAAEGLEGACGGRHAGASARAPRDARQRAGPGPSRGLGDQGASDHEAGMSRSGTWIRAIPTTNRRTRRPRPISGWKSSSIPRRNGALSCCPGGGWWSAARVGGPLSSPRPRLRTPGTDPRRVSLSRLRVPHAPRLGIGKFVTGSSATSPAPNGG